MKFYSPYTRAVLVCIRRYVKKKGYAPTLREIQHMLKQDGIARAESGIVPISCISKHVKRLAEEGKLKHTPGVARGIMLLTRTK